MHTHFVSGLAHVRDASSQAANRLFPHLPALEISEDEALSLAARMSSVGIEDNPRIPAGYTYLGQFIDHDLTFDPLVEFRGKSPADGVVNVRTPAFDLDSVYGLGPVTQPHLYDKVETGVFLIGKGRDHRVRPAPPTHEDDLPRNQQGTALVGDPRNDQNIMVSQIHLAFLRLHNLIFETLVVQGENRRNAFERARKLLQWHFQWIVLHDFLPRLVGSEIVAALLPPGEGPARERFRPLYFKPGSPPTIPLEFSGAAYRIGHSMVRDRYALSDNFESRLGARIIFHKNGDTEPLPDLRGGRFLPWAWSLQWNRFFQFPNAPVPQLSQSFDTKLAPALRAVPGFDPSDLALRNILRSQNYRLPSGQAVAQAMGIKPLEAPKPEPLWFYILREAASVQEGARLGPVGARIVAEVLLGVLVADANAFVNAAPAWRPSPSFSAPGSRVFEMRDLIHAAGMPVDRAQWTSWVDHGPLRKSDLGPSLAELLPEGPGGITSASLARDGGVRTQSATEQA